MQTSRISSDDLADLDITKRLMAADTWIDGALKVARVTKNSQAKQLVDYLDKRAACAAPMPDGGIYYFFSEKPKEAYSYYVYIVPLIRRDLQRLLAEDSRRNYVSSSGIDLARYNEGSQAIYLPNRRYSDYGKGVLLLHEAMHAKLDNTANKNSKDPQWIEEAKVLVFEFSLLDTLLGSAYIKMIERIKNTIRPKDNHSGTYMADYQFSPADKLLIKTKMQAKYSFEVDIWLGVAMSQAYWSYFQANFRSPISELAWYLEQFAKN